MKPQELRIGNWVITKTAYDKPTEIQVHRIGANGINDDGGVNAISFDDLEGIELNTERLEKLGFKAKEYPLYTSYYRVFEHTSAHGYIQQSKFSLGRNGTEVFINDNWLRGIDYLHQLQNLFLDITNSELTLAPEKENDPLPFS